MKVVSLYIHIPFCIKKCGYCDFISFAYFEEKMERYLEYLKREMKLYREELKEYLVETIFIGGGTPSILSGEQMKELMETIKSNFDLSMCKEISMESNPGTISLENLVEYKKSGINRISIGVQTLNDKTLKSLDRIHSVNEVYDAMDSIKKAGLYNFNMDLMFGLPSQTLVDLEETLDGFIKLEPTHISAYSLKYEEGTDFYQKLENRELEEASETLDREMYHLIVRKLEGAGYFQYEISNFAKVGFECKHNLVYWENKNYIGMGLGAHSSFDDSRYYNAEDFDVYYNFIDSDFKPVAGTEKNTKKNSMFESIMLSFRLNKGLNIEEFNGKYEVDFEVEYEEPIGKLKKLNLLVIESNIIKLTNRGRDLLNQVLLEFLD